MKDEMRAIFDSDGRNRESRCCVLLLRILVLLDENRRELAPKAQGNAAGTIPRETVKKIIEVADFVKNNLATEDLSQSAMADALVSARNIFQGLSRSLRESIIANG